MVHDHRHNIAGQASMKRLTCFPLLLLLTLLLAACGDSFTSSPTTGPIDTATAHSQPAITPSMMAIGNFKEYPLPQNNSGLMRPAIDHAGRIWFGGRRGSYLALCGPRTRKVQPVWCLHGF